MGNYMTPEDATLAGNYSEWDEDAEYLPDEYEVCCVCGFAVYDNYCDECEEYLD